MRFLIQKLRIKQVEAANALGTTEATISRVVHEKMDPGLDTFVKMCVHLNESMDRVVRYDPPWAEIGGERKKHTVGE